MSRDLNTKRSNMFQSLAIAWIRRKRPDVVAAINAEVEKKHPNTNKVGRAMTVLPANMDKIN